MMLLSEYIVQTRKEEVMGREVSVTLQEDTNHSEFYFPLFYFLMRNHWLEGRLHATHSLLTPFCFIASCEPAAYPEMTLKNCLEIADDACTVSLSTKMKTHCF